MDQALDVHWTVSQGPTLMLQGAKLRWDEPLQPLRAALGPSSGRIKDNDMRESNSTDTHRGANFAL